MAPVNTETVVDLSSSWEKELMDNNMHSNAGMVFKGFTGSDFGAGFNTSFHPAVSKKMDTIFYCHNAHNGGLVSTNHLIYSQVGNFTDTGLVKLQERKSFYENFADQLHCYYHRPLRRTLLLHEFYWPKFSTPMYFSGSSNTDEHIANSFTELVNTFTASRQTSN